MGEVDPSGNLTASRSYDVYGTVRTSAGTSTSKHKFVGALGHPSDDETGLIYMRARYMDPVTGRFASEDPKENGNNWFSYCSINPVNRVDKTGKFDVPSDQCAELLAGYLGLATALLLMAAFMSAGGGTAFATCASLIMMSGCSYLLADALKDVVYPNAGAFAAFFAANVIMNQVFNVAKGAEAAGWLPAIGNAIGGIIFTSVVAETYMLTMD